MTVRPASPSGREPGSRALLAFYGDDFTGASENMAQFHRHGLKTFMFLDHPSQAELAEKARAFDVVGIAGTARSLGPDRMRDEVGRAFRVFRDTGFQFVQYKLCSTFDSSRTVGNLGVVVDLAREVYPGCLLPVFAAMPEFGRYTAFGQHFAAFGAAVLRLDRHPSMSRHPTTPMKEADLRRILEDQGTAPCGLVDLRAMAGGAGDVARALARERTRVTGPIVLDGLTDRDCRVTAEAMWSAATEAPVVVLSAQGFAHGFGLFRSGRDGAEPHVEPLQSAVPLLVVSGSAAPVTARQIGAFREAGADTIRLSAPSLLDPGSAPAAIEAAAEAGAASLGNGQSICLYTALGPDDPDMPAFRETAARLELDHAETARRVGVALAQAAMRLIGRHRVGRLVIAGGDTSSYALRELGPEGLAVASGDYVTSAHVFRLSGRPPVDGLELTLKGGQVGHEGYFVTLRDGRAGSRA